MTAFVLSVIFEAAGAVLKIRLTLGRNSQNFLRKFVRFFVTLDLKILRLKSRKVVFEADINKIEC